ncbi:MAG: lysophospholipid acyltransferase family protein [Candidatus Sulfotelmatobacter sp.]
MPEASTLHEVAPPLPPIDPSRYTLRQRIVLRIIIWAGSWVIRLLGPTLKVCISYEEGAQKTREQRPLVESFWHSCMIPATYICRDMGVRVMSSNSYDGEYMGRIIRKFGFVAVKGSSSRNAVRALLGLRRALTEGWTVAFTLDGPRGPRHQVKPGPVALARSTGIPMSMFHVAVDRAWVLNSWDRMMIPKPFSRVLLRFGKLIHVPPDATDEDVEGYTAELQVALDRVCEFAEAHVNQVGTSEFPCGRNEQK